VNSWTAGNRQAREDVISMTGPDIILVTETKLRHGENITLPGFTFYGNNRRFIKKNAKVGSGGVGILIRNSILNENYVNISDASYEGILSLQLVNKSTCKEMNITVCYLPPEGSQYGRDVQGFFDHLLQIMYRVCDSDFIIVGGDFNGRIGTEDDYIVNIDAVGPRNPIDKERNKHGAALLEFLKESKLCTINGRITTQFDNFTSVSGRGKAVVDYLCTPHRCIDHVTLCRVHTGQDICERNKYKPPGKLPDHSIVCCDIMMYEWSGTQNIDKEIEQSNPKMKRKKIKMENIPSDFMKTPNCRELLDDVITRIEYNSRQQEDIDQVYDEVVKLYQEELDRCFPIIQAPRRKKFIAKPWWDEELTIAWKRAGKLQREFLHCQGNLRERCEKRNAYKMSIKNFDKQFRKKKRTYLANQGREIEQMQANDPQQFWNVITNLGPNKKEKIPAEVLLGDGTCTNDKDKVLEEWQSTFQKIYQSNTEDISSTFNDDFLQSVQQANNVRARVFSGNCDIMNRGISLTEVLKAISKSKLGKATGEDNIPNEVLKNDVSVHLLHKLFNACFKTGFIPDRWRKCLLQPILKSGSDDKRDPKCYRGISLLSCIYKLYSSILTTRLTDFLENNSLLPEEQNGFRKQRSCLDHLYTLTAIVRNRKLENKDTFTCFIDMRKAFDTVDRDCLLYMLYELGIRDKLLNAIDVIYARTECAVLVRDFITPWFITEKGVKQGDTLSPCLFSVYLNDLVRDINRSKLGVKIDDQYVNILLYADDIVILSESEENLQKLIDIVLHWCNNWRMSVNCKKTKIVHFRKNSVNRTNYVFKYDSKQIDIAPHYKYLGCVLEETLDFTLTANMLSEAAGRAVGAIVNKCIKENNFTFNVYTKLYNSCVIPIMDYCSGIWGYARYDKPNTVQHRAIRSFLGVHRYASNVVINGDTGWTPPIVRRKLNILKLVQRMMNMPVNRLTHFIFMWDWKHKGKTWSWNVRQILKETHQEDVINDIANNAIDFRKVLHQAEVDLMNIEIQRWKNELDRQPKLRFYKLFKEDYKTELYVQKCHNKSLRSFIAQIRAGVLPLQVEVGRFIQQLLEDRMCKHCKTVEDELHFIFECPLYTQLRIEFYNNVCQFYPLDELNFSERLNLFMSKPEILYKFGSFIRNCFYRRNSMFYNSVS